MDLTRPLYADPHYYTGSDDREFGPRYCPHCDGTGEVKDMDEYDGETAPLVPCDECGGTGELPL